MILKVTDPSQLLKDLSHPLCLLAIEYGVIEKSQITTLLYNITINYILTIVVLLI